MAARLAGRLMLSAPTPVTATYSLTLLPHASASCARNASLLAAATSITGCSRTVGLGLGRQHARCATATRGTMIRTNTLSGGKGWDLK